MALLRPTVNPWCRHAPSWTELLDLLSYSGDLGVLFCKARDGFWLEGHGKKEFWNGNISDGCSKCNEKHVSLQKPGSGPDAASSHGWTAGKRFIQSVSASINETVIRELTFITELVVRCSLRRGQRLGHGNCLVASGSG